MIVLVSMPWASVTEPSLGLGVLSAELHARGIPAKVMHLNAWLLRYLKYTTYRKLADMFSVNDFLFTRGMDESEFGVARMQLLVDTLSACPPAARPRATVAECVDLLHSLREQIIPAYLSDCADAVLDNDPDIVGFTCMYDQTFASVALAHEIKRRSPGIVTIFGGYGVHGETGIAVQRSFNSAVDVVVYGEGEDTLVDLAAGDLSKGTLKSVAGISFIDGGGHVVRTPDRPFRDMHKALPPRFDDYFADVNDLRSKYGISIRTPYLPVETSRGCWWGQKSHCTFCGIDDVTMRYRSKSAGQVISELDDLSRLYDVTQFRISDYILPIEYFSSLMPELSARGAPYLLSCETKSNLKRKHFEAFASAGFREIQPGIESFSTHVLSLMAKGVNALQNLRTIKLCRMFDIIVHYNILYGFSEELQDDYFEMLRLIPMISHLDPPASCVKVAITRYAPMQQEALRLRSSAGRSLQADHRYELLFSPSRLKQLKFQLEAYCYYFEDPFELSSELVGLYGLLQSQVAQWKENPERARLEWLGEDRIVDTRFGSATVHHVTRSEAEVLRRCDDDFITIDALARDMQVSDAEVRSAVASLRDRRLVVDDKGVILSLVLPIGSSEGQTASARSVEHVA